MLALGHDRVTEGPLTDRTGVREAIPLFAARGTPHLVVAALRPAVLRSSATGGPFSLELELFALEGLLVLQVELVAALVVAAIVDEDARVAEPAIPVLVVVFASLGVVVDSRRHLHERWRLLRAFERP